MSNNQNRSQLFLQFKEEFKNLRLDCHIQSSRWLSAISNFGSQARAKAIIAHWRFHHLIDGIFINPLLGCGDAYFLKINSTFVCF